MAIVVDVEAVANDPGDPPRVLRGVTAVAYDIARGSAAAYYPEANGLVALDSYDERSGTPTYKSIPVVIRRAGWPDAVISRCLSRVARPFQNTAVEPIHPFYSPPPLAGGGRGRGFSPSRPA